MKQLAILGAGESGLGAALLAKREGYGVWVSDMGAISSSRKEALIEAGIGFEEGGHDEAKILSSDLIIKSPGIPDKAPLIKKAHEEGIPVIDELEFACHYSAGKVIAITGTNGKTTTTLLTYHLLKEAGLDVGLAGNVGKSWGRQTLQPSLNEFDRVDSAYVPWLGKTVQHPEEYGIYFQERWDEALQSDPDMIYINDWNEWTAGKYTPEQLGVADSTGHYPFLNRSSNFLFVDQYNAEFNRGIQPMKGGATDNYYMQMIQNIRRYKGVREIPLHCGYHSINMDGRFRDWKKVQVEYRDTKGDVTHREHNGYGGLGYKNTSGRNDIVTGKVAVTKKNIAFYVETSNQLTSYTDTNWMLLLIDADNNPNTGWYGYDYLINKSVANQHMTSLSRYEANQWINISTIPYRTVGNEMELMVPRRILGLTGDAFTFNLS